MEQFFEFITTGFRGSGAPVMFMILVILFAAIGLSVERIWSLFLRYGKNTSGFMQAISKYLLAGEFDKALKYASSMQTPLAKVVATILKNRGRGVKAVQRAIDEVYLTESPKVSKFLVFLNVFANLSVLVGLMGTVYGFMEAFASLANVPAAQRAQALAGSIAVVMSSTLWGLIGAIYATFAHAVLANKADKILEELDEKSAKLINMIEE
jgi:biopolymer transport protein ExbB/TolQ